MTNAPSTLTATPAVYDPALEERWADWLVRCREQDLQGRRRLQVALVAAAIVALAIASSYAAWPGGL